MWGIIVGHLCLAVGNYGCEYELVGFDFFFSSLLQSTNMSFDALSDALLSRSKPSQKYGGLAKKDCYSIAYCVAVLCIYCGNTSKRQ